MSEDEGLDEHLASLRPEAETDAEQARSLSGVRCLAHGCGFRSPDTDLAGESCPKCDRGYLTTVQRTELRAKTCERCKEQFLWRFNFADAENARKYSTIDFYKGLKLNGPLKCRACEEELGAAYKYQAAKQQYEKSKKTRIEQRAAVARHKPRETR